MSKLTSLAIIVFIGMVAAILFGVITHTYFNYHYPLDTPFFIPGDRFMDFFNTRDFVEAYTYINQPLAVYFPLTYWVVYPFTLIPGNYSLSIFTLLFFGFTIYLLTKSASNLYLNAKTKNKVGHFYFSLSILVIFSFPFLFTVDRGNIEAIVFILSVASLYFFKNEKYCASAIFLSLSAGLKLYPFVFLLLFLKQKKYKEILLSIILFLILSILALLTLKGGWSNNLSVFYASIKEVSSTGFYANGIGNSVSLMSLLKMAIIIIYKIKHAAPIDYSDFMSYIRQIASTYSATTMIYMLTIAVLVYFFEQRLWAQIMQLTILILICPAVSFDYKLIHLLIPVVFFLDSQEKNQTNNKGVFNKIYFCLFALLLIPKNYYMYKVNMLNYTAASQNLYFSLAVVSNIIICLAFSLLLIIDSISNNPNRNN